MRVMRSDPFHNLSSAALLRGNSAFASVLKEGLQRHSAARELDDAFHVLHGYAVGSPVRDRALAQVKECSKLNGLALVRWLIQPSVEVLHDPEFRLP